MTLAPLLSGIQGARMESEFEISSFGLEGPGPSSQASENSASQEQEARPSQGLMFIVPGHTNQRPKLETGPQSAEPKKETNPLFENKPRKPEGAVPSGTLNDDKFIAVLKRLGLSA